MKKIILVAVVIVCNCFASFSQTLKINLEAAKITFVAAMQNTSGSVAGLEAKINFNPNDITKSVITGTVDVDKLETGNKKRDEHLKSSDFFDASTYPTMSFKSKAFKKEGDTYVMTGTMQIKNVKREETIRFSFKDNVFKGEGTIQAANYDLGSFAKKKPEKTAVKITFYIPVN